MNDEQEEIKECVDRLKGTWMEEWMDGWMDGRIEEWVGGLMNRW